MENTPNETRIEKHQRPRCQHPVLRCGSSVFDNPDNGHDTTDQIDELNQEKEDVGDRYDPIHESNLGKPATLRKVKINEFSRKNTRKAGCFKRMGFSATPNSGSFTLRLAR